MRFTICLLLLLTLSACESGPQVGDVYEHKLTQERIQIEHVGIGSDLRERFDFEDEVARTTATDDDGDLMPIYFTGGLAVRPIYREGADSTLASVGYYTEEQMRIEGGRIAIRWGNILNVADLEADYTLVD